MPRNAASKRTWKLDIDIMLTELGL